MRLIGIDGKNGEKEVFRRKIGFDTPCRENGSEIPMTLPKDMVVVFG